MIETNMIKELADFERNIRIDIEISQKHIILISALIEAIRVSGDYLPFVMIISILALYNNGYLYNKAIELLVNNETFEDIMQIGNNERIGNYYIRLKDYKMGRKYYGHSSYD